jgi:hypothetical protein
VFDEKAGTSKFEGEGIVRDASPATFTEREITWDDDISGLSHPYYTLDRTTGALDIAIRMKKGPDRIYTWQCSVAKQQF